MRNFSCHFSKEEYCMTRLSKALAGVVAVILIYFLSHLAVMAMGLEGWTTRPPLWDPAAHTLDGIHFARAFRHFSPAEFFVQIHNSGMWPPAIPLFQSPFQLLGGENFVVARNWTAWMAIPAVLIVFLTGFVAHRRFGLLVGTIAASLLAISPHFHEYMIQEMLEVPGIFFCTLTLFFYIRFLQEQKIADWQRTCLAGIVLFFCKFNYAVIVMFPIVVCEFMYRKDFRTLIVSGVGRFARDIRWRSPFLGFVVLYAVFLVYIHKVGINTEILGQRILIQRALGNPTYLLLAIILIRNYFFNREEFVGYLQSIWNAPEPSRSLLRFDILPAVIWLCYPVFFTIFFIFMFSEKTRFNSFWSMETLTFYPGALVNAYAPHPLLGAITMICLLGMIFFFKRLPLITRFLVALCTFNIALTILHPNYQIRYLMTSVPMLYLVTGLAVVHLWERLSQRTGARLDKMVLIVSPGIAAALLLIFPASAEHLQKSFIGYSQSEKATQLFSLICKESHLTDLNTLVGFSNYTAPSSIALQCYKDFPEMKRSQMPTTTARQGFAGEPSGARVVAANKIDRFFIVDYSQLGFDVGRLQEAPLLEEMKSALPGDGYEGEEILNQGEGGYRLTVYRKKAGASTSAAH
jgi:hypothetical protein